MKIAKKLDKILNILYDENLLHWKEIPATDFIAFAKPKFKIEWSDAEINLILTILQNDGYVVLNKKDINKMEIPSFSLTAKGVQMKRNGGFVRQKIKSIITNFVILWAAIFTIAISIYTIANYISDNRTKNAIDNDKPLNSQPTLSIPKVINDTLSDKQIVSDTTNNISNHNK